MTILVVVASLLALAGAWQWLLAIATKLDELEDRDPEEPCRSF